MSLCGFFCRGKLTVGLLVPALTRRPRACFCLEEWNLQLIDINRICGQRGAGTWVRAET